MRISDWSSDVCSSDLSRWANSAGRLMSSWSVRSASLDNGGSDIGLGVIGHCGSTGGCLGFCHEAVLRLHQANADRHYYRSEEHTSELQSLMRISYAVFCLKKKNEIHFKHTIHHI